MKRSMLIIALAVLMAGCGGGEADTGLLGRLPQGYDAYMTIDPEVMGFQELLEAVEENISEDALAELEEIDMPLNPFDWDEWKSELGIQDGEIGVVALGEDPYFIALFLPCDGEKLADFMEEEAEEEVELVTMGDDYTAVIIESVDDELIEDLEEALAEAPLAESETFRLLVDKAYLDNSAASFVFFEQITEMPIAGFLSRTSSETEFSIALVFEDEEMEAYSGSFGDGLQSSSIKLPNNTMAAMRTTADMEWLASEYDEMADLDESQIREMEQGLPFIGFESMEEFLGAFQGDFVIGISEIEIGSTGEPEGGAGIFAISLNEPEKLEETLAMVSAFAESERNTVDGVTTYLIAEGGDDIWYFISDNVLYVTYEVEPEEVLDGISAGSFFSGPSGEGFMGGAADPERLARGLDAGEDTEDLVMDIFDEKAEFTVSYQDGVVYSSMTAGPDALNALVELVAQAAE